MKEQNYFKFRAISCLAQIKMIEFQNIVDQKVLTKCFLSQSQWELL